MGGFKHLCQQNSLSVMVFANRCPNLRFIFNKEKDSVVGAISGYCEDSRRFVDSSSICWRLMIEGKVDNVDITTICLCCSCTGAGLGWLGWAGLDSDGCVYVT